MTNTASPQGKEEKKARPPAKKKTFIVLIRPEFKAICEDDACRAGMFNHILYNIARAKQQGSEYWHSTGDDIWEETQRSWGKSKTLKEIKDLVTTGLVAQTSNPKNSWDRTKYYTFGEAEAKKLHELCVKNKVCLASIKFPVAVSHLLNLTNAFCKNNKCICCNQQIDLLNLTDRFVDFNIPTDLEAACGDVPEDPKDSTQDSTQDSFLHADEVASYSQPCEPANEEKNEATFEQLDKQLFEGGSDRSWLQETSIHPENASQAPSELFPEPPKPNKHNIPDLRAGLNDRSQRPPTPAEQKRIDEQAARAKEQQEKKRTVEIWEVFDLLFGSHVDRYGYNKSHVLSLARNTLATDEIITTAFNAVANSQAVKNNPAKLTITEIANVVPSYIRSEQIKVVASQNKRKSIDEQIAESRRAAEEFDAQERARKERMVATHG